MDSELRGTISCEKDAFGGALILTMMDGKELPLPVISNAVKKYYAWTKKQMVEKWAREVEIMKKRPKQKLEHPDGLETW